MKKTLTQAVMDYQKTREGWDGLMERISLYIYSFPVRWTGWDEDRCSDFFTAFLPKVPGLVERFKPTFSFETYLASSMRWFMKTYMENLSRKEHYETWYMDNAVRERSGKQDVEYRLSPVEDLEFSIDFDPENCPFKLDATGRIADDTLRKRLVFAILIRAADIDFSRIPVLAKLTGTDARWLEDRIEDVHRLIADKIERREELKRKRNEYWFRRDRLQRRRAGDRAAGEKVSPKRESLYGTLDRRFESACEKVRRFSVSPTHEDVAQLVGSPPGTISSGLFVLRKIWNTMETTGSPPRKLRPSRRASPNSSLHQQRPGGRRPSSSEQAAARPVSRPVLRRSEE